MNKHQQLLIQSFGFDSVIDAYEAVESPSLSVIIPTYNCLAYLPTALKSIQQQKVSDLEIVILDDNSSDDTWSYLTIAAQCDCRIKPFKLTGFGVAKARNYGLEMAKGQYVAFLDADDYWFDDKLKHQLMFHQQNPTATLSFSNYWHFNEQNEDLGDCFGYWPGFSGGLKRLPPVSEEHHYHSLGERGIAMIFAENVVGTSAVMINRQALAEPLYFDETLKSAEDWDFWLQAAKQGPIGCTSTVGMAYLMRPGSETSKTALRLRYMKIIMQRHYKAVLKQSPLALLSSISRLMVGYAEHYRGLRHQKPIWSRWYSSLKPLFCHILAFILSPSRRSFRAVLADCKYMLVA